MKLQKKWINKGLLIVITLFIIYFIFSVFTTKTTNMSCSGDVVKNEIVIPLNIFLKIEKYKWPSKIWGNSSYGIAVIEIPNTINIFFNKIETNAHYLQFYRDDFAGQFSTLSNSLSVKLDNFGYFEGECVKIK